MVKKIIKEEHTFTSKQLHSSDEEDKVEMEKYNNELSLLRELTALVKKYLIKYFDEYELKINDNEKDVIIYTTYNKTWISPVDKIIAQKITSGQFKDKLGGSNTIIRLVGEPLYFLEQNSQEFYNKINDLVESYGFICNFSFANVLIKRK